MNTPHYEVVTVHESTAIMDKANNEYFCFVALGPHEAARVELRHKVAKFLNDETQKEKIQKGN